MKKSLLSTQFFISTTIITSLYLLFTTLLMNSDLIRDTFIGNYGVSYKIQILVSLVHGMWTSMTPSGLIFLFSIAILTGANLSLLFEKMSSFKQFDKLQIIVGGNSLLGIVGSGCVACGLPILSLLGLSGSLIYLPYRGAELSYVSFILLSISLYMLIKSKNQVCAVI